jgi:hypothetical protein
MIAEIYGKINNMNSNLTERSEDELTGNFFGNLRYLPFNKGLKYILKRAVYPVQLAEIFDSLDVGAWHDKISFWPRYKGTEPDVLLSFDNVMIAVEVKYRSGLSSDDDVDNSVGNQEWKNSSNQLAREGEMLEHIAGDRTKVLIFLAPESSAHQVYTDVQNRNLLNNDVLFGYITWQKVFDALQEIRAKNVFEKVSEDDLIALLRQKGFEGFRSFDISCKAVCAERVWTFDYSASYEFSFIIRKNVERGLHYEFR